MPNDLADPADLGILEAAELLRARALSSAELVTACLRRIEALEAAGLSFDGAPDAINAWVRLYPEAALASARAADERRAKAGPGQVPMLCGVPLALKDLYAVEGLPLTASSRVLEGNVSREDSAVWKTLRAHGMVLLGHTHTHEFAAGGTTDQVGNPWALDRVAGGSSGGNGAALAARMVPAACGTDTCGSLRIPSACCGTSTIKPAHGVLPLDGIVPLAPSLDHPGPMARTVADCAALLAAMAGLEPAGRVPEAQLGPRPLEGVRIGFTDRSEAMAVEQPVQDAVEQALAACEALGARVIALQAPWTFDWGDLSLVLMTEVWRYHAQFSDRHDYYRPALAEFVEAAQIFTDEAAYQGAQERRREGAARWEEWFGAGVDMVLEPTLPIVPYERGVGYERGHAGGPGDPMIALTALWNMTAMPVVSLPVSWCAGISLIAPRGRESALIQAATDLQEHALPVPVWTQATV